MWKHKFLHTPDSPNGLPVAENLLGRRFNPTRPNHAWVSDITYIRTQTGGLYLAAVMELYFRRIVGWAMARTCGLKGSPRPGRWQCSSGNPGQVCYFTPTDANMPAANTSSC